MTSSDEPTPEEQRTADLVDELTSTGNLHPLIKVLRAGDAGPERARDALQLLGELDLALLVQISLDTLISDYVEDPGLALQNRRAERGQEQPVDVE